MDNRRIHASGLPSGGKRISSEPDNFEHPVPFGGIEHPVAFYSFEDPVALYAVAFYGFEEPVPFDSIENTFITFYSFENSVPLRLFEDPIARRLSGFRIFDGLGPCTD